MRMSPTTDQPSRYTALLSLAANLALTLCVIASLVIRGYGVLGLQGYSGDFGAALRQGLGILQNNYAWVYREGYADHPVALYRLIVFCMMLSESLKFDSAIILKFFYALFEVLTGLLLFVATRRHYGSSIAKICLAIYCCSPVFWHVGSFWGHHGATEVFFNACSVVLLARRKFALSIMAFAAAISLRIHSIVIAPFLLIAIISLRPKTKDLLIGIAGALAINLVLSYPLLIEDPLHSYSLQYGSNFNEYKGLDYGVYNVWNVQFWRDITTGFLAQKAELLGTISKLIGLDVPTLIGLSLFSAVYGLTIIRWFQLKEVDLFSRLLSCSAVIYMAFYFLPTRIHERYIYHALVFLTPLIACRIRYVALYSYMTAATLCSFIFFPAYLRGFQTFSQSLLSPTWISLLNISCFIFLSLILLRNPTVPANCCVDTSPQKEALHKGMKLVRSLTTERILGISLLVIIFTTCSAELLLWSVKSIGRSSFRLTDILLDGRASNILADNAATEASPLPDHTGFEFKGASGWWKINRRFFFRNRVVHFGVLVHPQPNMTRNLELPIPQYKKHLKLIAVYSDEAYNNINPAPGHLRVIYRGEEVFRQVIRPESEELKAIITFRDAGKGQKHSVTIQVEGTANRPPSDLDWQHLYLWGDFY